MRVDVGRWLMLTAARILHLYGSIYPAWEYEIDPASLARTGRRRARQFVSYPRRGDGKAIVAREFR